MEQLGANRAVSPSGPRRCRRVGNYVVGPAIGRGSFSTVHVGRNTETGASVALKVIEKADITTQSALLSLTREITVLRAVCHRNVLRLEDVMDTARNVYIVTQLCSGGCLYDYVMRTGGLPEDRAAELFAQLLDAVAYLHDLGFVHRDIKPDNILLNERGEAVLTDFGLSVRAATLSTRCGSPAFAAPELVCGAQYTNLVDLWACGVTLFLMVTGELPFTAPENNLQSLYSDIVALRWHAPPRLSAECAGLLSRLLTRAETRLTAHEALQHPWIRNRLRAGAAACRGS